MPYQGDAHPSPAPATFTTDFSYLRKLPGAFILVQLVCCTLGFVLGAVGSTRWRMGKGHAFFNFMTFINMMSCVCWLLIRVLHFDAMIPKKINWNIAGLVHNGVNGLLLMIASCCLLGDTREATMLRAAVVYGFLGYSAFLVGFVWEAIIWRTNRNESSAGFSTATVIRGRSPESEPSIGVADPEESGEERVSFVGMKPRPVSSFLEQQSGTSGGVSSPMLVVPQNDTEDNDSKLSSAASSTQCEWQMASTNSM